ncbi:MAG: hypothetical protein MUO58_01715 [Anaerolineales bacterium]|nr:hypothetical protein [Anaerolineales bacterium]HUS84916.1 hypothetical protein [Anaerolineales bacterium]
MTLHGFILGLTIASACAFLFHILRGGSLKRLAIYLASAWIGFFSGHLFSELINWQLLRLGSINLFPALLGTILSLVLTAILIKPNSKQKKTRQRR